MEAFSRYCDDQVSVYVLVKKRAYILVKGCSISLEGTMMLDLSKNYYLDGEDNCVIQTNINSMQSIKQDCLLRHRSVTEYIDDTVSLLVSIFVIEAVFFNKTITTPTVNLSLPYIMMIRCI